MLAAITAFLTVLALLLEAYAKGQPTRTKEAADARIERVREDIGDGNAVAVDVLVNELLPGEGLPAEATRPGDGAPGEHGDEGTAERIQEVLGSEVVLR